MKDVVASDSSRVENEPGKTSTSNCGAFANEFCAGSQQVFYVKLFVANVGIMGKECVNLYLPARDSQMTKAVRYRRIRQDQEVVLLDQRSWFWVLRWSCLLQSNPRLAHRHWHSSARGDWKRPLSGHADISNVHFIDSFIECARRCTQLANPSPAQRRK